MKSPCLFLVFLVTLLPVCFAGEETIPLPEHPRPDFERPHWLNLNGTWQLRFDADDVGEEEAWHKGKVEFPKSIVVPFSWGSPLSGVEDEADIGWYARAVTVPGEWEKRRVFLVVGASDWRTSAWLDGELLGTHEGGYTPFSFELTGQMRPGESQRLVIRVDDRKHPFKLEGKQGYGPARGIWQTPYLEARGNPCLENLHFTPDVDRQKVEVSAKLLEAANEESTLELRFKNRDASREVVRHPVPAGSAEVSFDVAMTQARLWSLEDPYLYEVEASLGSAGGVTDQVSTYFGMRKISVVDLPGTDHRYIALNNEPVYLQLTLDQAYHPEGFYTFPSDTFIRDEILRSRRIGLNGQRIHVKIGIPRKLYWADRLGLLIMADVPNSWGEPDERMRRETKHALLAMIERDFNHPSIFSWVLFNETWGLRTEVEGQKTYTPEAQKWVASMVQLAKNLDPSRLVEDNSPHREDHVVTDINSWHAYLPGHAWEERLADITAKTHPGSSWNFAEGYGQGSQPNINSEFGNVWGYEGSTGDVDWSWDYHRAVNAFRRHPKIAGWLYTEHHDVVNEWNGYWRYDRSAKHTGLSDLVEGMSMADLHAPFYIATGGDLSREVQAGSTVEVPLWASFMTSNDAFGSVLTLRAQLDGWNPVGEKKTFFETSRAVSYRPWMSEALEPLEVPMPEESAVAILSLFLEDAGGNVLHRNFTTFVVEGEVPEEIELANGRKARLLCVEPSSYAAGEWSLKQWEVLDGLKVNGAGSGYFEYRIPWPNDLALPDIETVVFLAEASAKQLFGKDRDGAETIAGDFMLGKGTHDPSLNPNAYPMTDDFPFPSAVAIRANGWMAGRFELEDDPADHRGILSWHAQLEDKKLREAGSYGQLLKAGIPSGALVSAAEEGVMVIRLEVDEALPGGLALYGARFGRYPLDPTLLITLRGVPERR
jgi:hypothetical protein